MSTEDLIRRLYLDGTSTAREAAEYLESLSAVKPLDFSNCLKHAFLSGVVAARAIPGDEPCDGPALWTRYEPYVPGAYSRLAAALSRTVD